MMFFVRNLNCFQIISCLTIAILLSLTGCQKAKFSPMETYETMPENPNRDTATAKMHNKEAIKLINMNMLESAENELKLALSADLFFGPAHNNLGTVYYRQKRYYLAAWEFQYAAKLMPKQPQPQNNLGLVYEAAGQLKDAENQYNKALTLAPEEPEVLTNLARIRIRSDQKDEETQKLLSKIVMNDHRPQWVSWAKEHLAFMKINNSDPKKPHQPQTLQTIKPLSELIE